MKLSVVSALVRKGINLLVIFVVLYYVLTVAVIPFVRDNLATLFPSKDAPTVLYGLLPPLEFVNKPILSADPVYQLNTKTGKLPDLANKMIVYKYLPWRFSYADGTNAQKHASILGFTDADLITDLKGEIYRWRNVISEESLSISIHSKELDKSSVLAGKYGQFTTGIITQTNAVDTAKALFTSLGRFEDPLYKSGTQTVTFGRITGTGILETINPREAHIARVDLFKTINTFPVYGPDPKKGLLETYIGYSPLSKTSPFVYPSVTAYYWETEPVSEATYPLVPLSQAWGAVSKGEGIITSVVVKDSNTFERYSPIDLNKILINNVFLAYYETPTFQEFMQPIYVFEGNFTSTSGSSGSIMIYYPAVSGKWVKPTTPTESYVPSN